MKYRTEIQTTLSVTVLINDETGEADEDMLGELAWRAAEERAQSILAQGSAEDLTGQVMARVTWVEASFDGIGCGAIEPAEDQSWLA